MPDDLTPGIRAVIKSHLLVRNCGLAGNYNCARLSYQPYRAARIVRKRIRFFLGRQSSGDPKRTITKRSRRATRFRNIVHAEPGVSVRNSAARVCERRLFRKPRPTLIECFTRKGRLAQRESIGLTSRGSQVQILYRPPAEAIGRLLSGS